MHSLLTTTLLTLFLLGRAAARGGAAPSNALCASWPECEAYLLSSSWFQSLFGLRGSRDEAVEHARLVRAAAAAQLSTPIAPAGSLASKLLTFPFTLTHALRFHIASDIATRNQPRRGPSIRAATADLDLERFKAWHRPLVVHVAGWAVPAGEETLTAEEHRYKIDKLCASVLRALLTRIPKQFMTVQFVDHLCEPAAINSEGSFTAPQIGGIQINEGCIDKLIFVQFS